MWYSYQSLHTAKIFTITSSTLIISSINMFTMASSILLCYLPLCSLYQSHSHIISNIFQMISATACHQRPVSSTWHYIDPGIIDRYLRHDISYTLASSNNIFTMTSATPWHQRQISLTWHKPCHQWQISSPWTVISDVTSSTRASSSQLTTVSTMQK